MVPFAGYDMPVQYPRRRAEGASAHPRRAPACSTSRTWARSRCGRNPAASTTPRAALERWCRGHRRRCRRGRQRYALFTNDAGGILDDLMVANRGDHLFLVVNAACKDADDAHLRAHLADDLRDRAAATARCSRCRGRRPRRCWRSLRPRLAGMRFMDVEPLTVMRARLLRLALRLYRRGRLRDLGAGRRRRAIRARAARRSRGDADRPRRPRQPAARGRPLPLRPRHRHHDHAGRGRAGLGDPEEPPHGRRARRRLSRRRRDSARNSTHGAPRTRASACSPRAARRCAKARCCSPMQTATAPIGTRHLRRLRPERRRAGRDGLCAGALAGHRHAVVRRGARQAPAGARSRPALSSHHSYKR